MVEGNDRRSRGRVVVVTGLVVGGCGRGTRSGVVVGVRSDGYEKTPGTRASISIRV